MFKLILLVIIALKSSLFLLSLARALFLRYFKEILKSDYEATVIDQNTLLKGVNNLAKAVTFKTIATKKFEKYFYQFHSFIKESYPLIDKHLEKIEVGEKNLVFKWAAKESTKKPILLMAHQDVVPSGDNQMWTYPPFKENIASNYVWGRGSFDAKGQLIAILEAVELLLSENHQIKQTLYIAFGCDEEIRGDEGAKVIASYFESLNITFAYVLDEGGVVAQSFIKGLKQDVAVIGIAEKGNLNVKLSVTKKGGHSSSPDNPEALAILGKAMWNLEKKRPKALLTEPIKLLFKTIGLYGPLSLSLLFLNLWLTKNLLFSIFGKNKTLNALIRTTAVATMAKGSDIANVIESSVSSVANVRLLPNYSSQRFLIWANKVINNKNVKLEIINEEGNSKVSLTDTKEFAHLKKTILATFPFVIPTPYLMVGASDALWYEKLSCCVYRFTPVLMNSDELNRMHGPNERLSFENLERAIRFYHTLISNEAH